MPKIRFVMILVPVLLPTVSCSTDRDTGITTSSWATSEDGQLALRFAVEQAVVEGESPIVLIAEIANCGNGATVIIAPFADDYYAQSSGVKLQGPRGRLKYTGPTLDTEVAGTIFHRLEPGESITDRLKLTTDLFAGCDAPGRYSLRYTYKYRGGWDQFEGAKSAWQGEIVSNPVTLTRR